MSDGEHSRGNRAGSRLGLLVRLLIAAAILTYLARRVPADEWQRVESIFAGHWRWLLLGTGLTFLGLLVGAARWAYLLGRQGIRTGYLQTFRIFFIGQFFNSFMLGACGGDVARAYYVIQHSPDARTKAASTVLADRMIGLFVVVVFSAVMIACRVSFFLALDNTRQVGIIMLVFLALFVIGGVMAFRTHLFKNSPQLRRLQERTVTGRLLRKGYDALFLYRSEPVTLVLAAALSLLNLFFLTLAVFAFGRGIGISLPVIDYFTLFPLIIVVTAIPVTPGALGIREYCFTVMFRAVGVGYMQAITLSLLVYAGGLFWSLLGGLLFIGHEGRGPSIRQQLRELRQQAAEE
ncbi:MAG: flippase-like domain-containing protein [Verrucomicrobia bacterium]|nr:flippase-like domain-containing protein [Verrucomicrobiota bacterium]